MKEQEFNEIVKARCEKIIDILAKKQNEYSFAGDRLHHYHAGARILNVIPERVLFGQLVKHFISTMDIIDRIEEEKVPAESLIDEKLGDLINYCILLECVLRERIGIEKSKSILAGEDTSFKRKKV
jgi:hypothetical protein